MMIDVGRYYDKRRVFRLWAGHPNAVMSMYLLLNLHVVCCDDLLFACAMHYFSEPVSFFLFFIVVGESVRVFSPHLMILFLVLCLPRGSFSFLFGIWLCWGRFLVIDLGCRLCIRDQYGIAGGR